MPGIDACDAASNRVDLVKKDDAGSVQDVKKDVLNLKVRRLWLQAGDGGRRGIEEGFVCFCEKQSLAPSCRYGACIEETQPGDQATIRKRKGLGLCVLNKVVGFSEVGMRSGEGFCQQINVRQQKEGSEHMSEPMAGGPVSLVSGSCFCGAARQAAEGLVVEQSPVDLCSVSAQAAALHLHGGKSHDCTLDEGRFGCHGGEEGARRGPLWADLYGRQDRGHEHLEKRVEQQLFDGVPVGRALGGKGRRRALCVGPVVARLASDGGSDFDQRACGLMGIVELVDGVGRGHGVSGPRTRAQQHGFVPDAHAERAGNVEAVAIGIQRQRGRGKGRMLAMGSTGHERAGGMRDAAAPRGSWTVPSTVKIQALAVRTARAVLVASYFAPPAVMVISVCASQLVVAHVMCTCTRCSRSWTAQGEAGGATVARPAQKTTLAGVVAGAGVVAATCAKVKVQSWMPETGIAMD